MRNGELESLTNCTHMGSGYLHNQSGSRAFSTGDQESFKLVSAGAGSARHRHGLAVALMQRAD